jgi:hypothetical protein
MVPCFMFTLSLEGFSSQSSQSPSRLLVFSHLCELCVSAFSSLPQRCHPAHPGRSRRERSEGSAFLGPCTLSLVSQKSAPISPFPATLTTTLQITENKTTLSLVFATLTGYVNVNPCVCHSYKKTPGVGVAQTSVCALPGFTTHHPLLTSCSSETNSARRAANPQWLPTWDTARAAARAPSLWSVSKC